MSLTKASYSMINGAPFNVLDYGADPTNTNDSYTAFQAAINAVGSIGGTVYVPAGVYKISTKLTITNKAVNIVGDGMNQSKLVFSATATGGLEFDLTKSNAESGGTASYYYNASVADLSILTLNTTISYSFSAGGSGAAASMTGKIAVAYIPSGVQAGSPYPTAQLDRVYIGGYNGFSQFWDVGVYLPNAVNVLITDCNILGRFNTTNMSVAVGVLNQAVNIQLSNTFISYGGNGVFVYSPGFPGVSNNGVEGIQIVGCQIVGLQNGVYRYYGSSTDMARPLTLITGSHFNCMNNCVSLVDTTETIITGNLFYVQNVWGGSPAVPAGAAAIGISYSYFSASTNRHTITGNIFRNLSGVTQVRGIISNVKYATISGNTFTDFDFGIILQSNAQYNIITGAVFENVPTQIQNGGDTTNGYSAKTSISAGSSVNPF